MEQETKGKEIPQQLYVQTLLEAFFFLLKKSPQFACFTIVAFFPCSCSPEMLDYQDFQIVGCRIKGILLYIM